MEQIIAGASASPVDVNMNNFMAEVIDGSSQMPVVVQFWAPWCGPCKQLGPILEKVVGANAGKVKMVRVNIDENAEIAQQMRVQSVPTVFGFVNGQPVDGFAGAQAESTIKQFIDKLIASGGGGADAASLIEAGNEAVDQQDFATAMTHFQQAMEADPESREALGGVIRCLTGMGDHASAREVADQLSDEYRENKAIIAAIAALDLAERAAESAGGLDAACAVVAAEPENLEARQELAMALFAVGENAAAMEQLLESIRIDRTWNEEAARVQLLDFFTSIGVANTDVMKARRKLSTLLFS
ncbi:thioredoxin [Alphaproteobacteria bacterium]|nr:thioredoxin [Alphaproteobacteria bacterium]